ncbi:MAG: chloride channel protein [Bryobacteraceae bacterium]
MKKLKAISEVLSSSVTRWTEAEITLEHEDKILLVLTLVIGAIVGLVVTAFILVTENLGSRMYPAGGAAWRRLMLPIGGALITGYLLRRHFPNARGSGIPQTKTAFFIRDGLILWRTVVGKFVCSSVSLATGIALGREGPSVHIGAGIASVLGRRLGLSPQRVKSLIPIGSAAALAAAFNTPIAAVLFTLEEVMGDMHAPVLGAIVLSSATAWMVLHLLLGDEPLFHVPAYQLVHPIEFALYAVLGAAGGLVSVGFVKLLLWQRKRFLRLPGYTQWFQPSVGGLMVGVLGWFVPQVMGVGYGNINEALNGHMVVKMMVLLVVLKVIATTTCYASGNAGGIFGPSLFIGAMLGGAFGGTAHSLIPDYTASVGAYALVGMGAAFAGIIRVPLTSVIMIFEVTRDYAIIVPLMIANLISYFISSRLQRKPIYEALQEQEGIRLPPAARDREELMTVGQACHPAAEILSAIEPIGEVAARVNRDQSAWPVVQGRILLGMVTIDQLETAVRNGQDKSSVGELVLPSVLGGAFEFPHIYADDPLDTAMRRMAVYGLKVLPVVSRAHMHELTGIISVDGILGAYGLDGERHPANQGARDKSQMSAKVLVRTLIVLFVAVILTAVLSTVYRSERAARAQRLFSEGEALMARERTEEAIEDYRAAVSISHNKEHRLALALALVKADHEEEAKIYLSELLQENPHNGPANLGLGRIKVKQGDVAQAVESFDRAIHGSWPGDAATQKRLARLELIDILGKSGHRERAQAELLLLKAEMPADAAFRRNIGQLFLKLGMPAESIAINRDLLKANKNDDEALAGMGEAELALGHLVAAQSAFHSAAISEPENTSYQARVEFLDSVISMDPGVRGLDAAERYLRSRNLVGAVLAAFEHCHAVSLVNQPDAGGATAETARRSLLRSVKPRSYGEATETNIEIATQLWSERMKLCGAPVASEIAVSRAVSEASH